MEYVEVRTRGASSQHQWRWHVSTPTGDQWVDGTYEAGADEPQRQSGEVPNPETGVGLGEGEGSTFEPEEDAPGEDDDDGT
jgi:hypothetical protein